MEFNSGFKGLRTRFISACLLVLLLKLDVGTAQMDALRLPKFLCLINALIQCVSKNDN